MIKAVAPRVFCAVRLVLQALSGNQANTKNLGFSYLIAKKNSMKWKNAEQITLRADLKCIRDQSRRTACFLCHRLSCAPGPFW